MIDLASKRLPALSALFLSTACTTAPASAPTVTPENLLGTWDVALYFSQDSPPSATVMDISSINRDGTVGGTFYASPFESGRVTERDGAVVISVITSDGSGPYATSGRLITPDQIDGQTLSTGRDFLMTWSATKR